MNKNLITVDVQPFYHNWHKTLTPKLIEYINSKNYDNILYFFNGEDMGIPDNLYSIQEYLSEWGLDDDKLEDLYFIEKDYSFFRGWMDGGIDDGFIVYIVKYMIKVDLNYSRDIHELDLKYLVEKFYKDKIENLEDIWDTINTDPIMIPNWDYSKLQEFDQYDLAGGGKNECLKEIEILLQALDLKYVVLNNLTY